MITACAIMLTHPGREEMAERAKECFESQTYCAKSLVINCGEYGSIGEKRNAAIRTAIETCNPEVLITWDSDDVSHPNRIAEQVAFLQSSGADIVGYSDLLFWDARKYAAARDRHEWNTPIGASGSEPWQMTGSMVSGFVNESWLYTSPTTTYAPGTTLAFWRKTWEARPYPATSDKEDYHFGVGRRVVTTSSIVNGEPRMVATIHGQNTMQARYDELIGRGDTAWKRAAEWDEVCSRLLRGNSRELNSCVSGVR